MGVEYGGGGRVRGDVGMARAGGEGGEGGRGGGLRGGWEKGRRLEGVGELDRSCQHCSVS